MVRTRLILGTALIAGVLVLLGLDVLVRGGPMLHLLVGAGMVVGLLEFQSLAERGGRLTL